MTSPSNTSLLKAALITLVYLCALFVSSALWQNHQHSINTSALLKKLENEVNTSLLPKSDNYFGMPSATLAYMAEINVALKQAHWNMQISKIADISFTPSNAAFAWHENLIAHQGNDSFSVTLEQHYSLPSLFYILLVVPLFAISLLSIQRESIVAFRKIATSSVSNKSTDKTAFPRNKLIVDLREKELRFDKKRCSSMSLKQFAFYVALLEVCAEKNIELFSEDAMPDELLMASKKHYKSLVELGHPKRGRPEFDNNVTQTISLIRSALNTDIPDLPQHFIPPKASGEGSRIKRKGAQYALRGLDTSSFIIKA